MEIKTCEQYVLNELNKAQDRVVEVEGQLNELQRIIFTVQNALELSMNAEGFMYIDIDEYASTDPNIRAFLIQLLGRGKYTEPETKDEADAEENVEA